MASIFGDSTTKTITQNIPSPTGQKIQDLAYPKAKTYAGQSLKWPTAGGHPAVAPKVGQALTPAQHARLVHLNQVAAPGGPDLNPAQAAKRKQLRQLNAMAGKPIAGTGKPAVAAKPISPVVPFTQPQVQGQADVMAGAGAQKQIAQNAAGAEQFLTSPDILNPATNPAEAASIAAATRPIYQNLMESVLPNVRSGAASAGQYGSSRQGIAEGEAARSADQAAGQVSANIANADYQAGLDAMTKGLGLSPATGTEQTQAGASESAVGEIQQQQQEAQNQARLQQLFYNMGIPLSQAQNLTQMAAGQPGGGTSASTTPGTNLLNAGLGGALTGSQIGSAIGGPAGAGVGAGLGTGAAVLYNVLNG
jgi:hypothetical protein